VGDYVLVVQEGKSARMLMGVADAPCEAIIVGVVDYVQRDGRQHPLRPPAAKKG
jgi:microcompartment protein CcmK/EutM